MPQQGTEKDRGWLLPAARGDMRPGLTLAATPIGNLGDITLRVLDALAAADLVVCEDTRVSGRLLTHFGIDKPLIPYNDHNAAQQRGPILEKLRAGGRVVLISDAGTPLVSDPGYKLVRAVIAENFPVTALPGANAPLTALQLSGLPSDGFCFIGFLPPKSAARRTALETWAHVPATVLAFETGPRLSGALEDIRAALGEREVAVARELTKLHEEVRRGPVSGIIAHYAAQGEPKGEIVLAIGAGAAQDLGEDSVRAALAAALKETGPSEAAARLAKETGWPRKKLYALALEIAKE